MRANALAVHWFAMYLRNMWMIYQDDSLCRLCPVPVECHLLVVVTFEIGSAANTWFFTAQTLCPPCSADHDVLTSHNSEIHMNAHIMTPSLALTSRNGEPHR